MLTGIILSETYISVSFWCVLFWCKFLFFFFFCCVFLIMGKVALRMTSFERFFFKHIISIDIGVDLPQRSESLLLILCSLSKTLILAFFIVELTVLSMTS